MFLIKNASNLPLFKDYNYTINLINRKQPFYNIIYSLLQNKLSIFYKYINKNLVNIFIRLSQFPIDTSIFFMPKLNKYFQLCIDY